MHSHLPLTSCVLLLACGSVQPVTRHDSWPTTSAVEVTEPRIPADLHASQDTGSIPWVYAAADTRHCDQQQIACFNQCWEKYPPYPVERGNKGQYLYCTSKCLAEYIACVKDAEASPRTFLTQNAALDWLGKHKTEVLVGTLVFVSGTVFIIATGGTGALILVPVAVLQGI